MCADKTPEETPEEVTPEDTTAEQAGDDNTAAEAAPEETTSKETKADKKDKNAQKDEAAEETSGSDKPKKSKRWMLWVGGLIAVFIIMFIPFWFTRNSASCGQCHSMQPYYTSWQKSWHGRNETPCMDCHVKPGAIGENLYRFLFYRELFAEIFKLNLKPWGATVPGEGACTRDGCHSLNRLSSTAGDIKISHEVHVKVVEKRYKKACSYCHAGASHEGIKGLGSQLPPRRQCFLAGCHRTQVKQCDFCHTIKYKPGTVPKTPHF